MISLLQMRKRKHEKVKQLVQSHRAIKWQIWGSTSVFLSLSLVKPAPLQTRPADSTAMSLVSLPSLPRQSSSLPAAQHFLAGGKYPLAVFALRGLEALLTQHFTSCLV